MIFELRTRRSSSCRTDLMIHFQPSRPTTIWMFLFILVTLTTPSSSFYYETDDRKCERTLSGWHCGLRLLLTRTPASHGIRTQVFSMTCMLHRPERYHLHHRGGNYGVTVWNIHSETCHVKIWQKKCYWLHFITIRNTIINHW